MIFNHLKFEKIVQVNDKTRLSAERSFSTLDETITNVEIEPEAGAGFISVFNSDSDRWYLDWAFKTDGDKTASVRVTTDTPSTETTTYPISVLSVADDKLFSDDNDIFPYEPDIHRYLPPGKNSFLYAHREAQTKILEYLDEQRIWKRDGSKFTKTDLVTIDEFRRWSLFQTLVIVFESIQLNADDIFQEKVQEYNNLLIKARNRASLRLDRDGDGKNDTHPVNVRTTFLVRR